MNPTLVIVPTYNEAHTIEAAVQGILQFAPDVDVLIVDDNSPDGTGQVADQIATENPQVRVLHRNQKQGLGPAYLAGFELAINQGYQWVVEMDADGSHRPIDLPKLLAHKDKADLVIGSRYVIGGEVVNWPMIRQAISRFGNFYARFMLGSKVRDITAGYRVYRTSLLQRINLHSVIAKGYAFQVQLTMLSEQLGARIVEVPITFVERVEDQSKMTKSIVIEAFWLVTKWSTKIRNHH